MISCAPIIAPSKFGKATAPPSASPPPLNFYKLLDLAGMSLLIGQGIGRWGNFTNQEAFGINTDSIFGMTSEKISDYISNHASSLSANGISMDADLPVHPTFLYESIWCLFGFVVLYIICKKYRKFDGPMKITLPFKIPTKTSLRLVSA